MKKSRFFAFVALFSVLLCTWTACGEGSGTLKDGSYEAVEQGFGGEVSLNMTVESGKITKVVLTGEHETPSVGQAALPKLAQAIINKQGANIDTVAGASHTSKAVQLAAAKALNAASGKQVSLAPVKMADGVYKANTWSFSPNFPLELAVTVKNNRFEAIDITGGNDTKPIIQSAINLLIPRMIEQQSVSLDAITGATTSSNAIKSATEDCLLQAIKAGEGDTESIQAFYIPSPKVTKTEELSTDVLVIGMGGSGIVSAVRAAEKLYAAHGNKAEEVKVLGLEKAGKYGGTSAVTSSPMSINPPSYVAQNKGQDFVDVDELKAAWIDYTQGDAKEWAIDDMMQSSGSATDWLMERGFTFGAPMQGLAQPYIAVVAYGKGFGTSKAEVQTYYDAIMDHYTKIGGKYMLETTASDYLVDNTGAVTGVVAKGADGTIYNIHAKAVILASGGFAGSYEMTEKYLSTEYYPLKGAAYNVYGMRQNDGAMLEAAIEKGAATYNIGVPPVSHIGGAAAIMHEFPITVIPDSFDIWSGREMTQSLNDIPMMLAVAPNALAVTASGVRFTDETALGSYGNWQAGPRYYTLWSSAMIDEIRTKGLRFDNNGLFVNQGGWPIDTPVGNIDEVMAAAEKHGIVVKADTLEALAAKLGMKAATLKTTVDNYNSYCDTKKNPADGIEKSAVVLDLSGNPIKNSHSTFEKVEGAGPYYAVIGSPWIYSSTGGLDINEDFQVLNKQGKVIDGLYAVGTDSIGVLLTEKNEYVGYGGVAQGWAFTSGYLAGDIVADSVK